MLQICSKLHSPQVRSPWHTPGRQTGAYLLARHLMRQAPVNIRDKLALPAYAAAHMGTAELGMGSTGAASPGTYASPADKTGEFWDGGMVGVVANTLLH